MPSARGSGPQSHKDASSSISESNDNSSIDFRAYNEEPSLDAIDFRRTHDDKPSLDAIDFRRAYNEPSLDAIDFDAEAAAIERTVITNVDENIPDETINEEDFQSLNVSNAPNGLSGVHIAVNEETIETIHLDTIPSCEIDALVAYFQKMQIGSSTGEEIFSALKDGRLKDDKDSLSNLLIQALDAMLGTIFHDDDILPEVVIQNLVDHLQQKLGSETKNPIFYRIGQSLITAMKQKKPGVRTPLMSLTVKNAFKWEIEDLLGEKISNNEWRNANLHFEYPGPGEPVPKKIARIHRKQVRDEVISNFIEWLYASDLLESLSFGQKVVKFSNGYHFAIESIKRTQSYATIIRKYAQRWMVEMLDDDHDAGEDTCINVDSSGIRCCRAICHEGSCDFTSGLDPISVGHGESTLVLEDCEAKCPKTGAQCYRKKGHDGRHKFTPEDQLSPSTIANILSTLTNGEIKSLAGLDNTDVIKGHENFENMRSMVRKLMHVGRMDASMGNCQEADDIIASIDNAEKFHKYGFPQHLGREDSLHRCTCIQCGLCHEELDPVECKQEHIPPCKDCQESFQVVVDLFSYHETVRQKLQDDGIFTTDPCIEDDLDTWKEDIKMYLRYLLDYRAHIVHKEDEAIADAMRYRDLAEDECVVIFDYKMKILASKHLEAQIDWFAKRGFSCLGVLIIFGTSSNVMSNNILYHFFISDDTTQDTDAINTAKHFLYKEALPKYGMKKVHFRCNGAAAFNCTKSKAAMPRWFGLSDEQITEVSFKVSVSGGGKTSLDGMFGILTQHLKRLVNYGKSFSTAEELYDLLIEFPLQHSEFHLYQPKRNHLMDWSTTKAIDDLGVKNFYLLTYDQERKETTAFYHSRHSMGIHMKAIDEQLVMHSDPSRQDHEGEDDDSFAIDEEEEQASRKKLQKLLSDLDGKKVNELKGVCRQFGLKVTGLKAELLERLRGKISEEITALAADMNAMGDEDGSSGQDTGSSSNENDGGGTSFLPSEYYEDSEGEDYNDQCEDSHKDEISEEEESNKDRISMQEGSDDGISTEQGSKEDGLDMGRNTSTGEYFSTSGNYLQDEDEEEDFIDSSDPWIHIIKSTMSSDNEGIARTKMGVHSKIDYMTRKLEHNADFMGKKNEKFFGMQEKQVQLLQNAGRYCCPCVNEDDNERCTRIFRYPERLKKHMERCGDGSDTHTYPSRDLLSTILVDATKGKWALALACGSMPNRCRALSDNYQVQNGSNMPHQETTNPLVPSVWNEKGCYRRDKREKVSFRASAELAKDLELLYLAGERRDGGGEKKNASKYTPAQAVARLANMKGADGRRKYSHRDGNKNGPLPSEAYVRQWFSRRKSNKKRNAVTDAYDAMELEELKQACIRKLFQGKENIAPREFTMKMIALDDASKDEHDVCNYDGMSTKQLNEIRKAKELPTANTKKSFKYMLRMYDKLELTNEHAARVQNQFECVLAMTDALENIQNNA